MQTVIASNYNRPTPQFYNLNEQSLNNDTSVKYLELYSHGHCEGAADNDMVPATKGNYEKNSCRAEGKTQVNKISIIHNTVKLLILNQFRYT